MTNKTEWPVRWISLSLGYFVCGMGSRYFMVLVRPLQDDCCTGKKLKFMLSFASSLVFFNMAAAILCF